MPKRMCIKGYQVPTILAKLHTTFIHLVKFHHVGDGPTCFQEDTLWLFARVAQREFHPILVVREAEICVWISERGKGEC